MKKHRVFIFAAISFVIVLSAVIFLQKNAAPTRLTTDEVAALRGQYPVCSGSPPLIETVPLSLADCAAMADTFCTARSKVKHSISTKAFPIFTSTPS